jgi:hypothetical protein
LSGNDETKVRTGTEADDITVTGCFGKLMTVSGSRTGVDVMKLFLFASDVEDK